MAVNHDDAYFRLTAELLAEHVPGRGPLAISEIKELTRTGALRIMLWPVSTLSRNLGRADDLVEISWRDVVTVTTHIEAPACQHYLRSEQR